MLEIQVLDQIIIGENGDFYSFSTTQTPKIT
ncbi:hypothetical protein [Sporomusa sp. KB1]